MSSIKNSGLEAVTSRDGQSIEREAIEWHQRLSRDTDQQIEDAFDHWMAISEHHRQAYLEAELLGEGLDQLKTDSAALSRLTEAFDAEACSDSNDVVSIGRYKKRTWLASAVAVAASITFFTMFNLGWFSTQNEQPNLVSDSRFQSIYHSEIGRLKKVELPDGTHFTLGPNSFVKVVFNDSARRVELVRGEAYFDVVSLPNKPFFVEADLASVKVVGTRFDVRRLSQATSVSVVEGAVQVFNGKESARLRASSLLPTTLLAGQYAKADGDTDIVVQEALNGEDLVPWLSGRLTYRGAELRDVLADANRYSLAGNIRLRDPSLADKQVTLSVNIDSIDELPLMLAELMDLTVDKRPTETILSIKR
ncbi:hypothetical protein NBRC116583_37930 [Arenicella sp. 4NH20-0111]|uniref:FecR family protein n=1 Tax=Arenicella sp. 4NH20-0111 TaxID=3127648 RepID=UPI003103C18A